MKRRNYYILIISLFTSFFAFGQGSVEVIKFADEQFEKGNYLIAVREYNRALFFGTELSGEVSLKIGHCYTEMGNYSLGASFYNQAYKYSSTDSLKNEAVLGKTLCHLLRSENMLAFEELLYANENRTKEQSVQYYYLKGIAGYGLEYDSLAYEAFQKVLVLSEAPDSVVYMLSGEFKRVFKYNKRYNPTRAYIMSAIIPGSGQLSVGAFKEGINSMVLVAGLSIVAIQIIKGFSFLDAVITLLPWVQRYYMGGMDKAKTLAIVTKEKKRYQSYEKIIDLTTPEVYR
jgi:tetratricopeptide (TPR) repeat protein